MPDTPIRMNPLKIARLAAVQPVPLTRVAGGGGMG
jgi:hypothetical protein